MDGSGPSPHPEPDTSATRRGVPGLEMALARAFERGTRAHPGLEIPRAAFDASVVRRVGALRGDAACAADGLVAWVDAAAAEDLLLAVACECRVAGAWEALVAQLTPRLRAVCARRGIRGEQADTLLGEVVGSLTLPSSGVDGRPLLETYAGAGSLAAFATLLLARRRAREVRSPWARRGEPLDRSPDDAEESNRAALAPDPRAAAPSTAAARAELAVRASAALVRAWTELTPRERLVVAWKHVDGRSQREIAMALGIGEPRVSRLATSAVDRLRASVAASGGTEDEIADEVLRDVLGRSLRTLAAPDLGGPAPSPEDAPR